MESSENSYPNDAQIEEDYINYAENPDVKIFALPIAELETPESSLELSYCPENEIESSFLNNSIKIEVTESSLLSPEVPASSEPEISKCQPCGVGFINENRLHKHLEKHEESNQAGHRVLRRKTSVVTQLKLSKYRPRKANNGTPSKLLISSHNTYNFPKISQILPPSVVKGAENVSKIAKPSEMPMSNAPSSSSTHNPVKFPKVKKEKREENGRGELIDGLDHITTLQGEPPMYQCNLCMKKFKTKGHIKYHEFCQSGEKPFKCDECGQGFIKKSHFEYHLRTHTGERPYPCPECGKGFSQKSKVTRHMLTHTGEKPFGCTECGKGFANGQDLKSHFRTHTGERPYVCQYCEKRFTAMANLKKHETMHTDKGSFTCPHPNCLKTFSLKGTMENHRRTHSNERPYACDQCSKAFPNSKDLRRHYVIHSGERPFKCNICEATFRRKDNFDRHKRRTHH